MNDLMYIEEIMGKLEALQEKAFEPIKVQLHPNMVGFNSPKLYAIYKDSGGAPLTGTRTVTNVYEPLSPKLIAKAVMDAVINTSLKITNVIFDEHYGGAKVQFSIILQPKEIKASPMVGDIVEARIVIRTGLDGITKCSVGYQTKRLWCENGASKIADDVTILSVKNTKKNQGKLLLNATHLMEAENRLDAYLDRVGQLAKKEFNQKTLDEFFIKLTGYNIADHKAMTEKQRAIVDALNRAVGIEASNSGTNFFSVLQGVTRYTTHDMCKGDAYSPDLIYRQAGKTLAKAHALLGV